MTYCGHPRTIQRESLNRETPRITDLITPLINSVGFPLALINYLSMRHLWSDRSQYLNRNRIQSITVKLQLIQVQTDWKLIEWE